MARQSIDTNSVLADYLNSAMERNRGYPGRDKSSFDANLLANAINNSNNITVTNNNEDDDNFVEVDDRNYEQLQESYANTLDNYMDKSVWFPWAGTILGGSNIASGWLGGPTYGQGINWLNEAMGRPGEKLYDMFGGFNSFEEMNEYYKNQGFQDYIRKKHNENKDKVGFGMSYNPLLGLNKNLPTTN
tara:strand:+ start:570 stop:1133 length:564 start_codon:yes stop_codon:yes gene_type:complete